MSGPFTTKASGLLRRLGGSRQNFHRGELHTQDFHTQELPATLTPEELYISPRISASINAVIAALRWGAVLLGLLITITQSEPDLSLVASVAIALFLTPWRTIRPLRLGHLGPYDIGLALADVVILSLAISLFEGFSNPMTGTLLIAIAVAGFGWGLQMGLAATALTLITVTVGRLLGPEQMIQQSLNLRLVEDLVPNTAAMTALAGVAIMPGVALNRLLEYEGRRKLLVDRNDRLAQTNELLAALNDLARTLPSSLDLPDVVQNTRRELIETFDAKRIALLSFEDGTWSPVIQDGFGLPPELPTQSLPNILQRTLNSPTIVRIPDLGAVSSRDGSGLYIRLVIRNTDTGLLAIEHTEAGRYDERDAQLLSGMSSVLALTLANARSFNRLRYLAAAEERSRIARDLHDRLGQYLTYIAIELERINRNESSSELKELHEDVQEAITEFRSTLLELRAAVSVERPLSVVLGEVVDRFRARSALEVSFVKPPSPAERLPARVENELLRIAQEALTNIEKHAMASKVHVAWSIADGKGVLVVSDDGRGFDPTQGIRGNAYGLVGMRERATSVGAMLTISSQPEEGTVITVQSSESA